MFSYLLDVSTSALPSCRFCLHRPPRLILILFIVYYTNEPRACTAFFDTSIDLFDHLDGKLTDHQNCEHVENALISLINVVLLIANYKEFRNRLYIDALKGKVSK